MWFLQLNPSRTAPEAVLRVKLFADSATSLSSDYHMLRSELIHPKISEVLRERDTVPKS